MEPQVAPTVVACSRQSCDDCEIQGDRICVATPSDPSTSASCSSTGWSPSWSADRRRVLDRPGRLSGSATLFFGYVETFVLCRHCPAYAEEGPTLRCHANWGLPKFPRFDPRPLNRLEGATFLGYGAVLFLYHIPFFVLSHQWLLLIWCTLATGLAIWVVQADPVLALLSPFLPRQSSTRPCEADLLRELPRVRESVAGERATDKLLELARRQPREASGGGLGIPLFRPGGTSAPRLRP